MGEPSVAVIHRDLHLLVLYKPAGMLSTAPGGSRSLVDVARELDPKAPRCHPTSRLDAETSGVVVFARTRRATEALLDARGRGEYRRVYVALTSSCPPSDEGLWSWAIAIDPRDPRRRVALEAGHGGKRVQEAATDFRVAGRTEIACSLHARPRTGRTHQIRVHAARAGSPLLGDVHYGGAPRCVLPDGAVVSARRVMLHCAGVAFPHPVHGRPVCYRAAVPDDMRHLWEAVGGNGQALDAEP